MKVPNVSNPLILWKNMQKVAKSIQSSDIKVIYNKDGLFAIEKPYGLAVHSGPKVPRSLTDLLPGLQEKFDLPQKLELVNRLDKNVCGVLLLTYKREMAQYMAKLYRERKVQKTYLAIVVGNTNQVNGVLTGKMDLEKHGHHYKQFVDKRENEGDPQTKFHVIDNNKKSCVLCSFESYTGYKHQIRAHAAELLGCPVLGDHIYHNGPIGPQQLPLPLIQLLRIPAVDRGEENKNLIRPWQRGLIPLHLFAQKVVLPQFDNDEKDLRIKAKMPSFFKDTMEKCDLVMNRDEVDLKLLTQKKRFHNPTKYESPVFRSKGVSESHVASQTSL